MREIVLTLGCILLVGAVAGCLGDGGEPLEETQATPDTTNDSSQPVQAADGNATDTTDPDSSVNQTSTSATANTTDRNPWQAGLDDDYPTPDVAENRSAEERRADVAEPGDPRFAQFDATMQVWMAKHDIPTGQLAIMEDGQLAYESGYGYTDRDETQPANASTMFRLASVTKPMTAALVTMQVEQGLYNWTDPVFCVGEDPAPNCRLPIDPHPANPIEDDRLADVTVGHLVNHTGGWGDEASWIQFGEGAIQVADELDVDSPPSPWRTGQYLMGEELVHEPGAGYAYCNVCYMLAGLVAEAATGAELGALYEAYLFEPLEIADDIEPGRALPEDRNPREPFYACEGTGPNVFEPNETVCWPDGGWSMKTELGNGGLVATASAVAAVYEAYTEHVPVHHMPAEDAGGVTHRGHTGGFPGTATGSGIVVDGDAKTQFVVLFNAREPGEHCGPVPQDEDVWHQIPRYGFEAGCGKDDLYWTLFPFTAAWGTSQNTLPTPPATEPVSGRPAGGS